MSHTQKLHATSDPGIWNVSTDELGLSSYRAIADESGSVIALVVSHDRGSWTNSDPEPNARRLVAAWNACGGIPADDLEACPEGGLFHLADQANQLAKERDSLRAVNAELLEALTWAVEYVEAVPTDMVGNLKQWAAIGRAAIASARKQGEQT